MLPPQLQDTVDASQIPEPVRAKMQQIEAQLQQVTQAYEEAQSTIATDQVKSQERVALKERELAADAATQERDLQAKLQLEEVRQQGESARTLAKIEQERAAQILDTKITQLESLISRNVEQSNREQDRFERLAGGGRGAQASRPPSPKLGGPPPPSQPVSPPMGPPEREIVAPRPVVEEEVKEEEVL